MAPWEPGIIDDIEGLTYTCTFSPTHGECRNTLDGPRSIQEHSGIAESETLLSLNILSKEFPSGIVEHTIAA